MKELHSTTSMVAATTLALGTGILLYRNYSKLNLAENETVMAEGARDEGHGDTHDCVKKPIIEEIKTSETIEIKRQIGMMDIHSEISGSPAESAEESEIEESEIEFTLTETIEVAKEPTPRVDMRFGFVRKPAHIRTLLQAAGNRRKK